MGYGVFRNPSGYTIAWVHAIRMAAGKFQAGADPGRDDVAYETIISNR